jgi:hypothetical protein
VTASWDSHFKLLMTHAAQDYISWLIGNAVVDEELSPHLQRHIDADSIYSFHKRPFLEATPFQWQWRKERLPSHDSISRYYQ